MEESILYRLTQSPVFSGLGPEELRELLPCVSEGERTYAQGERVLRRGEPISRPGILLRGKLSLCSCGPDCSCGPQGCSAMRRVEENQIFGETAAFSSDCLACCDSVALEESRVLYLAPGFFLLPCGRDCPRPDSHRRVMANMLRLLSDQAVSLGRKVDYLTAPDLRGKIAMYLCDLRDAEGADEFQLPLNRDRLAELLAVARPSLSREMVRMKQEGLIRFERSRVELLQPDRLRALTRRASS